jgi:hypothetical protein
MKAYLKVANPDSNMQARIIAHFPIRPIRSLVKATSILQQNIRLLPVDALLTFFAGRNILINKEKVGGR